MKIEQIMENQSVRVVSEEADNAMYFALVRNSDDYVIGPVTEDNFRSFVQEVQEWAFNILEDNFEGGMMAMLDEDEREQYREIMEEYAIVQVSAESDEVIQSWNMADREAIKDFKRAF